MLLRRLASFTEFFFYLGSLSLKVVCYLAVTRGVASAVAFVFYADTASLPSLAEISRLPLAVAVFFFCFYRVVLPNFIKIVGRWLFRLPDEIPDWLMRRHADAASNLDARTGAFLNSRTLIASSRTMTLFSTNQRS